MRNIVEREVIENVRSLVMRTLLAMMVMPTLVAGCIFGRSDYADFDSVRRLTDFEGTYQNRGQPSRFHATRIQFLSAILWPDGNVKHAEIETIDVKAINADSLVVRALSERGVEKESTFVEGKDFALVDGQIHLKDEVRMWRGPGDPLFGPTYEHVALGIDRQGQGKYRQDAAGAGLVFMILPIVVTDREDIRFLRVEP